MAFTSANLQQVSQNLVDFLEKTASQENNSDSDFRQVVQGAGSARFTTLIEQLLAAIDGYGCWCNFDTDYSKGKGDPVNIIDGHCKTLALGYTCAIMDGREENDPCEEPWNSGYTPHDLFLVNTDPIPDQCLAKNAGDNCKIRSCIIEGHFSQIILEDFANSNVYDPNYKHGGGFFDPEIECVTGPGSGMQSEKSCCGIYPFVFPFKTYGNDRACCGSRTYDTQNKCCEDEGTSQILNFGQCS